MLVICHIYFNKSAEELQKLIKFAITINKQANYCTKIWGINGTATQRKTGTEYIT